MSTKNQREQLMHTIIGQITVIGLVIVASWIYTIPLFSELSKSVLATNETIKKYTDTSKNGISYEQINALLKNNKGKEELLGIIQTAPIDTKSAIKKIGGEPYLTWLKEAIESNTSKDEKQNLALKKARLNSILPTLNPISSNINEETVSMRKYITFVENNILKQFGIESTSALGIQNIQYGKKNTEMPEVVGSFDTEITFKATNDGIAKMINYINTLGHPEILINTGTTNIEGVPAIMSNPLAMIDTLSLENTIDPTKPSDENSGRMMVRFYIRGSSLTDITFLKETISVRKITLSKKIEQTLEKCNSELTCPRQKDLKALSRKYTEFTRAMTSKKQTNSTEMIYALSAELDSITSLEQEFKNLTGK